MNIISNFVKHFFAAPVAPPKVERFSALTPPEPVAKAVVPAPVEAPKTAVTVPDGAVKVTFNVKKNWDVQTPRTEDDLIACFGGGVVLNSDPFVEANAVAINGDPFAWYLNSDFIVGGGNVVDGLPTQVSFITNLTKAQVAEVKAAIKQAVKAGKTGIQLVVVGVPQVYAKAGDKNYDAATEGYAAIQVVGDKSPNLVLKCRLADGVEVTVAWKGHPDYVTTHQERALIDLNGLTGSSRAQTPELVKARADAKVGAALVGLALAARRAGLDVPAQGCEPLILDLVEAETVARPVLEAQPVPSVWDDIFGD
jgi:hypothetical protein